MPQEPPVGADVPDSDTVLPADMISLLVRWLANIVDFKAWIVGDIIFISGWFGVCLLCGFCPEGLSTTREINNTS